MISVAGHKEKAEASKRASDPGKAKSPNSQRQSLESTEGQCKKTAKTGSFAHYYLCTRGPRVRDIKGHRAVWPTHSQNWPARIPFWNRSSPPTRNLREQNEMPENERQERKHKEKWEQGRQLGNLRKQETIFFNMMWVEVKRELCEVTEVTLKKPPSASLEKFNSHKNEHQKRLKLKSHPKLL